MVFIPVTPKSTLKRMFEDAIRKTEVKMKVVERSGSTLRRKLQKSDPFGEKRCADELCVVCCGEDATGGTCRKK